jgi:hypothetical protein
LDSLDLTIQQKADERVIKFQENLGSVLVKLYKLIDKPINWPKVFTVTGNIRVKNIDEMPPVKISNVTEFAPYFDRIQKQLGLLTHAISLISQQPPKSIVPQQVIQKDLELHSLIERLIQTVSDKETNIQIPWDKIEFPSTIDIGNFPPTYIPTPVTHVSLNTLKGIPLNTDITVNTSATQVPGTNLSNRRALLVYNNSSNIIYLGGIGVTISDGMPLPPGAYSPTFNFSDTMNLYAIAAEVDNDVRVLELSEEAYSGQ